MLNELCGYLRNYFDKKRYFGDFTISGGAISGSVDLNLLENQYIRIVGSVLNDGVYQYPSDLVKLEDESFNGSVWALAIPKEVIALDAEIDAWRAKYEAVDGAAMSPFSAESFGGYSYQKSNNNTEGSSGGLGGWQNAFASRLSQWRKI